MDHWFKLLDRDGRGAFAATAARKGGVHAYRTNPVFAPGVELGPVEGPLAIRGNGYHMCRAKDLLTWWSIGKDWGVEENLDVWLIEAHDDIVDAGDQAVTRSLTARTNLGPLAKIAAAWLTEHHAETFAAVGYDWRSLMLTAGSTDANEVRARQQALLGAGLGFEAVQYGMVADGHVTQAAANAAHGNVAGAADRFGHHVETGLLVST